MRPLLLCILLITSSSAFAQQFWYENFDVNNSTYRNRFIKDTTHANNIWQIGKPQKLTFASAQTQPNAIITDTLNPYPINDTSIFIIKHRKSPFYFLFTISFDYKLDIDTTEKLLIEVSGDTGHHWVNVLTEDSVYNLMLTNPKPDLKHATNGVWKHFVLDMSQWAHAHAGGSITYPSYVTADTFLFRFTFISDSIQTNKDGWMMDNFQIQDAPIESVSPVDLSDKSLVLFPNPAGKEVNIHIDNSADATLSVYAADGRLVQQLSHVNTTEIKLPSVNYKPGLYFVQLAEQGKAIKWKRLTVIGWQ